MILISSLLSFPGFVLSTSMESSYVKTGKRNHLTRDNLPIPKILTNVETKTAKQQDFSLTVPKAPCKPPRKIIFSGR